MTQIDGFLSFTIAILLLLAGKILTLRYELLRRYSIPEPVTGGLICAAIVALAYMLFDSRVTFDLQMRDILLLLFFAGVGLKSDLGTLLKGGKPLATLVALATFFMIAQNLVGQGVATIFGMDARAGLMAGSISLTGGVGTTMAWSPHFENKLGLTGTTDIGLASNMVGLIAACIIGGPIAAFLIRRRQIVTSGSTDLMVGIPNDAPPPPLDYFAVLWAILALNVAVMIGMGLHLAITSAGVTLPAFVSCLIAGIAVRNLVMPLIGAHVRVLWPSAKQGLALMLDLTLGLFLTMALMGLQLAALANAFIFIAVVLTIQVAMSIAYALYIVFPAMGRDYEAAVVAAAFGGISLGSTATAIANMTSVTQQFGAAPRAFIIVPLVCGFFIDILNAALISFFVG